MTARMTAHGAARDRWPRVYKRARDRCLDGTCPCAACMLDLLQELQNQPVRKRGERKESKYGKR